MQFIGINRFVQLSKCALGKSNIEVTVIDLNDNSTFQSAAALEMVDFLEQMILYSRLSRERNSIRGYRAGDEIGRYRSNVQ